MRQVPGQLIDKAAVGICTRIFDFTDFQESKRTAKDLLHDRFPEFNMDEDDDIPMLVDVEGKETTGDAKVVEEPKRPKVPITIVTGYLGAGKTTLMNYILNEQHGKKIAVILNDKSDDDIPAAVDIEKSLTVSKGGEQVEEWLEVAPSISPPPPPPPPSPSPPTIRPPHSTLTPLTPSPPRDTGVNAIEQLMEKRGFFDYILLETTGLADPGNLAPLFWVDEGLGSTIYLDGIVTLIDCHNILRSLDAPSPPEDQQHTTPHLTTAHLQISHADVLVLNKSDLVSAEELERVKQRIRAINGSAKMCVTERGKVPELEGFLLDLHAYDRVDVEDVQAKGHSHLDPAISTVTLSVPPLSPSFHTPLDAWLRSLLWDSQIPSSTSQSLLPTTNPSTSQPQPTPLSIHRLKARLPITGNDTHPPTLKIIQGVREIFEILDAAPSQPQPQSAAQTQHKREQEIEEQREQQIEKEKDLEWRDEGGKIVLIGTGIRGLEEVLMESFMREVVGRC
ncbi:putative dopamine-responsive protein [Rutstroemia sp. NJR-2017a BVV2]|nr:putative dopamine-responsive protein [Rutstroemia sp. NJR-2017a BVV2]